MIRKYLVALILALWAFSLSAAHIEYLNEDLKFKIFNKKSGDIINYYKVLPGEKLEAKLYGVDQISILTRILDPIKDKQYSYAVDMDGLSRDVSKTISLSDVSKSMGGERISAYNKFTSVLNSYLTKLKIVNTSDFVMLVKLSGNNVINDRKDIEFVNFTPSSFETEKTLLLDEKEYTYYTSNGQKIELLLEGPLTLKIMSRLIFEYNYVNSMAYRYNIYDNNVLHSTFSDKAYKSATAIVKELPDMIPSNGDKNLIKLPEGVHHIVIEDGDQNRDLMFRFYISKSAIGVRN